MFAYCSDNPVAMIDTNGKLPAFVFKIGELIEDALNELGIGDISIIQINLAVVKGRPG